MENITSIVSLIRADCGTRADCRLMDTDSQKHIRDSFHFHDARIHNIIFSCFLPFTSLTLRQQDSVTIGSLGN